MPRCAASLISCTDFGKHGSELFFLHLFSFYLRSIYDVYQSSRALKFYILYNRRESEQKVTISYMTSNLKLMR